MLLSFDEYLEYGGVHEYAAFKIYSYEAEARVNAETHGRIKNDCASEAVKRCITRVCDILAKGDLSKENISSWSNDGVSESYINHTSEDFSQAVKAIIRTYLANEADSEGVPLLYLGVN